MVRVVMIEADGGADVMQAIAGFFGGRETEAVAQTTGERPTVELPALPAPSGMPKVGRGRKSNKMVAIPALDGAREDGARSDVWKELTKGPATSAELIARFQGKHTPAAIYAALTTMRGAKVVETRDIDGERKNVRLS